MPHFRYYDIASVLAGKHHYASAIVWKPLTYDQEWPNLNDLCKYIKDVNRQVQVVRKDTAPQTEGLSQHCSACRKKIWSSLPWILHRVQTLIKHVKVKKRQKYVWPNDYSYLRVRPSPPKKPETRTRKAVSECDKSSSVSSRSSDAKELTGTLEKVEASALANDKPGVQILMEVELATPETIKILERTRIESGFDSSFTEKLFSVFLIEEHTDDQVVHVLSSSPQPQITWNRKQVVAPAKAVNVSVGLSCLIPQHQVLLLLVALSVTRTGELHHIQKEVYRFPCLRCEVFVYRPRVSSVASFMQRRSVVRNTSEASDEELVKKAISQNNCLYVLELAEVFLAEKRDKMQVEKIKELETEMKGLKDLMAEVHKNQMELSKVLKEKDFCLPNIIKLTNPNMLDVENESLKKIVELELAEAADSSVEAIEVTINVLKEKFLTKNRMILTLLKGLRSSISKELWEEVVNYIFDESKPAETFDADKVNEFIRQTSLLLLNGSKGTKKLPSALDSLQERMSEEEPKRMKGKAGAIQGEEDRKRFGDEWCVTMKDLSTEVDVESILASHPTTIWGYPVLNFTTDCDAMESMLKKLENQVFQLSSENEKLWDYVRKLREELKNSVATLNENQKTTSESNTLSTGMIESGGKTINLTIQIGRKGSNKSKHKETTPSTSAAQERSTISLLDSFTNVNEAKQEGNSSMIDENRKLSLVAAERIEKYRGKSKRRSEQDLNDLDDTTATTPHLLRQENDKFQDLVRSRLQAKGTSFVSKQYVTMTPFPSRHDLYHPQYSKSSPRSKTSDIYEAGPSSSMAHRTVDPDFPEKPSLMELTESLNPEMSVMMACERELHTIPENDQTDLDSSFTSGQSMTNTIQMLRNRARAIHKDVTVLKWKNELIDKALDKLLNETGEDSESCKKIESDIEDLMYRLG